MNLLRKLHIIALFLLVTGPGSMKLRAQSQVDPTGDEEYNQMLDKGIAWQQKADSLYHLSIQWRKQAARMDDLFERVKLQQKILVLEDSLVVFRERADGFFARLQPESSPFIILDTILHGIRYYRYNLEHEFFTKNDTVDLEGDSTSLRADTTIDFKIYKGPVYTVENPFERDFIPGLGTFYRIQLAVFSKEITPDYFGGLFPITTETIPGKEMTRYFVGKFRRLEDAERGLQRVRSAGYSDSFIVGYYDGVKSTPEKLQTLEKE